MQQENLTKRSAHGVLWMGSSQIGSAVFRLLVLAILARWITPEEFGAVGLVLMVIAFSEIVAGLGVGQAIIQRKTLTEEHIASGFIVVLILGIFFAGLIFSLSGFIADLTGQENLQPLLRVSVLLFPIKAFDAVYRSLLLRKLNFSALALVEIASYSLGYGLVGVVLAFRDFGAMAIVLGTIAQYLLSSLMLWKIAPRLHLSCFNLQSGQEILKLSLGFNLTNVAFFLSQNTDKLIVFLMLGAQSMGLYGRALALTLYPGVLIGQPLDQVIFPILSTCQDDISRLKRAFRGGFTLLAAVAWPITIPLVVAAREIILLVLGPQWGQAAPVFQVLVLVVVVRFANKLNDSLTRAKGAVYRRAWRQWLYLATTALLCWVGSFFGLVEVAVGAGVAYFINYAFMSYLNLNLLGMNWGEYLGMVLKPLCIYITVLACTLLAASSMRDMLDSSILVIVLCFLIPFLLYGLLIYFAPRLLLGAETEWIMNSLWRMVPRVVQNNRVAQRILHQQKNGTVV